MGNNNSKKSKEIKKDDEKNLKRKFHIYYKGSKQTILTKERSMTEQQDPVEKMKCRRIGEANEKYFRSLF